MASAFSPPPTDLSASLLFFCKMELHPRAAYDPRAKAFASLDGGRLTNWNCFLRSDGNRGKESKDRVSIISFMERNWVDDASSLSEPK